MFFGIPDFEHFIFLLVANKSNILHFRVYGLTSRIF